MQCSRGVRSGGKLVGRQYQALFKVMSGCLRTTIYEGTAREDRRRVLDNWSGCCMPRCV